MNRLELNTASGYANLVLVLLLVVATSATNGCTVAGILLGSQAGKDRDVEAHETHAIKRGAEVTIYTKTNDTIVGRYSGTVSLPEEVHKAIYQENAPVELPEWGVQMTAQWASSPSATDLADAEANNTLTGSFRGFQSRPLFSRMMRSIRNEPVLRLETTSGLQTVPLSQLSQISTVGEDTNLYMPAALRNHAEAAVLFQRGVRLDRQFSGGEDAQTIPLAEVTRITEKRDFGWLYVIGGLAIDALILREFGRPMEGGTWDLGWD